jgi:hypothetical protein
MNAKWLSPEERDAAIKKQEEIRRQKEENKYKITIDFAGRKVISDQDMIEEENKRFQDEIIRLREEFQPRHGSDFRKPAPAPSTSLAPAEKKGSSPSPAQKTQAQTSIVPDDRSEHDETYVSKHWHVLQSAREDETKVRQGGGRRGLQSERESANQVSVPTRAT